MKRAVFFLPLVLCASLAAAAASPDLQASFDSLIAAEKAFSDLAVEKGIVHAFETIGPDALLLRPVPGAQTWRESMRSKPIEVKWEPRAAVLSGSGDFGWVTGPWIATLKGYDPAVYKPKHGQFLTIWRRSPDGTWKVVADSAIALMEPAEWPDAPLALKTPGQPGSDPAAARAAVLEIDRKVSAAAAGTDVNHYLSFHADGARLMRMFMPPVLGKEAIRAKLARSWTPLHWQQLGAEVSPAGDIVYSYGILEDPAKYGWEASSYMRIWEQRPDGTWAIVLDLVNTNTPHTDAPDPTKDMGPKKNPG